MREYILGLRSSILRFDKDLKSGNTRLQCSHFKVRFFVTSGVIKKQNYRTSESEKEG
jgi:hypothetical protein